MKEGGFEYNRRHHELRGSDVAARHGIGLRGPGARKALERQGKEIIHLEIGEPDFDTPAHIREAAKRALDGGATHYGPAAGLPSCGSDRQGRGGHTQHSGSTDKVVVTPGAKPIMFFVITALVNPGDEVVYPNPGFPIYESVINFVGGKPVPIPLREESGFGFDLDVLERASRARPS